MAIRNQQIHPDQMYPTQSYGPIPIISREALVEAMAEAGTWVDFAGGTVTLVVKRHPTDAPNESVTVAAMIQWKDRTDARPQPEPVDELAPAPDGDDQAEAAEPPLMPFEHVASTEEAEPEPGLFERTVPVVGDDGVGDGFDESELPEEDDSEIPAEARG